MEFTTNAAFLAALKEDLEDVVFFAANKIQEEVQEKVADIVYKPYEGKNRKYVRRANEGGFLGSWSQLPEYDTTGNLQVTVYSSPDEMVLEPPSHGKQQTSDQMDFFDRSADRRPIMAQIIAEGTDWDYYVPPTKKENGTQVENTHYLGAEDNWWTKPRDYWTPSLKSLTDGTINKVVKTHIVSKKIILK